jgi:hypothetical protein
LSRAITAASAAIVTALCALTGEVAGFAQQRATGATAPAALIWYRGLPSGTPRQDDLAVIRANGFSGVVWPEAHAAALPALERMARIVDLIVVSRAGPRPIDRESALNPPPHVDVSAAGEAAAIAPALAWRAIAHGARQIAFDPGAATGSGIADADGQRRPWVGDAAVVSRQLAFNPRLFETLAIGPPVMFEGAKPDGVDVVLLDGGRWWMLVATNASRRRAAGVVRLPTGVPPALWLELNDGSNISMLHQPDGPRWTFGLASGGARVYVIDK